MNNILSEKEYQKFIMDRLKDNGYEVWPAAVYDRLYAVDRQELFRFLNATQPDTMKALYKIYKTETEETIVLLAPYKGRGIVRLNTKERKVCIYGNRYCIAHYCCATPFSARSNGNGGAHSHLAVFKR